MLLEKKHLVRQIGIISLFALVALFIASCGDLFNPAQQTKGFFADQDKDPQLVGKWLYSPNKTRLGTHMITFSNNGKLEGFGNFTQYFYTDENHLYTLEPGEGFSKSGRVNEYEYKIVDDSQFYMRSLSGTKWSGPYIKQK